MQRKPAPPELVMAAMKWSIQQEYCSASSIAEYLGCAPGTVRRWLNGTRNPPRDRPLLAALFEHLGEDAPALAYWLAETVRESHQPLDLDEASQVLQAEAARLQLILSEGCLGERSASWWHDVERQINRLRVALAELEAAKVSGHRGRRSA